MIYCISCVFIEKAWHVAILAIMELGDLPVVMVTIDGYFVSVAILAIMELGDLHKFAMRVCSTVKRRNPRYNGIG